MRRRLSSWLVASLLSILNGLTRRESMKRLALLARSPKLLPKN
jgi:hypothetical protein